MMKVFVMALLVVSAVEAQAGRCWQGRRARQVNGLRLRCDGERHGRRGEKAAARGEADAVKREAAGES